MNHISARILPVALALMTGCATSDLVKNAARGSKNDPQLADRTTSEGRQPAPVEPYSNFGSNQVGQEAAIAAILERADQNSRAGRIVAAKGEYETVLARQSDNVHAHHELAIISDKESRFAEAERHYLAALQVEPRNSDILSDLGYSYMTQGSDEKSEQALNEALRHTPNHRKALFNLGALYSKRGDYDRALATFRRAGSESEAQAAIAALFPQGGGLRGGEQVADALRNPFQPQQNLPPGNAPISQQVATVDQPPQSMRGRDPETKKYINPATQKIAEEMDRQIAEQQRRTAALKNRNGGPRAPDPGVQVAQPFGGYRPAQGDQPLTPQQRQQAALEYLHSENVHPGEINNRFRDLDGEAQAMASQSSRPRTVDGPPSWAPQGNAGNGMGAGSLGSNTPRNSAFPESSNLEMQTVHTVNPALSSQPPAAMSPHWGNQAQTTNVWNGPQSANLSAPGVPAYNPPAQAALDSAARNRAAWEQAKLQAAQMGMNAGSGLGQMLMPEPIAAEQAIQQAGATSLQNGTTVPGNDGQGVMQLLHSQPTNSPPNFNGNVIRADNQVPAATPNWQNMNGAVAPHQQAPNELPAWPGRQITPPANPLNAPPSAQAMSYGAGQGEFGQSTQTPLVSSEALQQQQRILQMESDRQSLIQLPRQAAQQQRQMMQDAAQNANSAPTAWGAQSNQVPLNSPMTGQIPANYSPPSLPPTTAQQVRSDRNGQGLIQQMGYAPPNGMQQGQPGLQ